MTDWAESSALLAHLRRVREASVLYRALESVDSALARAVAACDNTAGMTRVIALASRSWMVLAIERIVATTAAAWRDSTLGRRLQPLGCVARLTPPQRIEATGLALVVIGTIRAVGLIALHSIERAVGAVEVILIVALGIGSLAGGRWMTRVRQSRGVFGDTEGQPGHYHDPKADALPQEDVE